MIFILRMPFEALTTFWLWITVLRNNKRACCNLWTHSHQMLFTWIWFMSLNYYVFNFNFYTGRVLCLYDLSSRYPAIEELSQVVAEKNIINLSCFPSVAITTSPVAGFNNLDINLRSVSSKLVVCLYKLSQFSFSATQTLYNQMGPGMRLSQNKYKIRLKWKLRWFFRKLHQ